MTLEIASSINSKNETDSTANLSNSFSSSISSDVSLSTLACVQEQKGFEHSAVLSSEIPSDKLTQIKSQEGEKQCTPQVTVPDPPTESKDNSPPPSPSPSHLSSPTSEKQTVSDVSEHSEPKDPPTVVDATVEDDLASVATQEDDQDTKDQHHEALDSLREIEAEFAKLRDRIYRERIEELEKEIVMVEEDTHPELMPLLDEIESKKRSLVNTANAFRNAQMFTINNVNYGAEYQIHCDYENSRKCLKANLSQEVTSKKQRLKKEYEKLDEEYYAGSISRKTPRIYDTNLTTARSMIPELNILFFPTYHLHIRT
ncbi:hypothetical protein K7432_000922 [Basidiobolus ranarum]|uniref:Uncharacterized protein n=1 Tax=Basidiobolus ranarum TaxID=34480 RepID=A0ABR2X3S7_9FUNG